MNNPRTLEELMKESILSFKHAQMDVVNMDEGGVTERGMNERDALNLATDNAVTFAKRHANQRVREVLEEVHEKMLALPQTFPRLTTHPFNLKSIELIREELNKLEDE